MIYLLRSFQAIFEIASGRLVYRQSLRWLLLLLLAIGFLLRVWGITFGLPFYYHIDEWGYLAPAWHLQVADFNISNFTPSIYIIFSLHRLVCFTAEILNLPAYISETCVSYANGSQTFFLLGRLLSAFFGTATIMLVYITGKKLFGQVVGLIAAVFLTFMFIHIRDSHYATPDVTVTLFTICAFYFCILIRDRNTVRDYTAASLFIGLAIATKWTAVLLVIPFLWAHITSAREIKRGIWPVLLDSRLFLSGTLAALVFVVGTPWSIVNPEAFARQVYNLYQLGRSGGFGIFQVDNVPGWIFYLKTLRWGAGDPITLLSIVGVLYAIYKHSREDMLVLSFLLPYYLYMGRTGLFFARYVIPMLPFLTLLAARVLEVVVLKTPLTRHRKNLSCAALTGLLILPSLHSAIQHNLLLMQEDTRTIARKWLIANVHDGAKIAVEWHGPPLPEERYDVHLAPIVGLSEHIVGPSQTAPSTVSYYKENGFKYLIISSFIYSIQLIDPQADKARRLFYESLDNEAELIKEFKPYIGETAPPFIFDQIYGPATSLSELERPGPIIKIYRLP